MAGSGGRARASAEAARGGVHRFVLDLAYAEIGARMGTTEEAARQNVSVMACGGCDG